MEHKSEFREQNRDAIVVAQKIWVVAVPATVGLICYAFWQCHDFFGILGSGLLVSLASLLGGGLGGFLFGIPKSGTRSKQLGDRVASSAEDQSNGIYGDQLRRNTNIEEISDWLTKIIVGLGIFELKKAPSFAKRLANFLSPAFGSGPGSGAVAIVLVAAFFSTGLLLGYLLTVLFLTRALVRASPGLLQVEKNLEQDAKTANAIATIATNENGTKSSEEASKQMKLLAQRYERERSSRPPGRERTEIMEEVTSEMRKLAILAYPALGDLSKSSSSGERLAAIAMLQIKPNFEFLPWLADRVSEEVPFLKFQAAFALRIAARGAAVADRDKVGAATTKAKKALEDEKRKDSDEYRALLEAESEMR